MNNATLRQASKVLELLTDGEVSSKRLQYFFESGLLADLFNSEAGDIDREEFRRVVKAGVLYPTLIELPGIHTPVREAVPWMSRISWGDYGWFNSDMKEEYFPFTLPSSGDRNLVIARFKKIINAKKVENWAAESGYELARIEDLLSVGEHEKYRRLQLKFSICALGSVSKQDTMCNLRMVPCLYSDTNRAKRHRRCLGAVPYGNSYCAGTGFLLNRIAAS